MRLRQIRIVLFGSIAFSAALACSNAAQVVASQFVKSAEVGQSGGSLQVNASDSPNIAGTSINIPAGALSTQVLIEIGIDTDPTAVAPSGSSAAGPVIDFFPDGTHFNAPVTIQIPVTLETGDDTSTLSVQAVESDGTSQTLPIQSISGNLVTFQANGFTRFGAWRHQRGNTSTSGTGTGSGTGSTTGSCDGGGGCVGTSSSSGTGTGTGTSVGTGSGTGGCDGGRCGGTGTSIGTASSSSGTGGGTGGCDGGNCGGTSTASGTGGSCDGGDCSSSSSSSGTGTGGGCDGGSCGGTGTTTGGGFDGGVGSDDGGVAGDDGGVLSRCEVAGGQCQAQGSLCDGQVLASSLYPCLQGSDQCCYPTQGGEDGGVGTDDGGLGTDDGGIGSDDGGVSTDDGGGFTDGDGGLSRCSAVGGQCLPNGAVCNGQVLQPGIYPCNDTVNDFCCYQTAADGG